MEKIKPCAHLFGHCHEGRGVFLKGETLFLNVSLFPVLNKKELESPFVLELASSSKADVS